MQDSAEVREDCEPFARDEHEGERRLEYLCGALVRFAERQTSNIINIICDLACNAKLKRVPSRCGFGAAETCDDLHELQIDKS